MRIRGPRGAPFLILEKNHTTSSVARMNLVLHGIEDFHIAREDTLRNPTFTDGAGGLATFDCVIANLPFSLKEWGREVWENDPWGRAQYGLPPDGYGDFAFVQHMIASMAQGGSSRMAVVLPQGALFRKSAEGKIREALLKEDMIEAVIGLAPNLFYGTSLAGCVVILRRNKAPDRKNKVLIIDAQSLHRKWKAQNLLDPEHGEQIVEWFQAFEDVEDRAQVVSLDKSRTKAGHSISQLCPATHRRGHSAPARGDRCLQGCAHRSTRGRRPPANRIDRGRMAQ